MKIMFTRHSLKRINERKISKEEAECIIRNPDSIARKEGLYFYRKSHPNGVLEVCVEKTESVINVITVYWV